MFKIVKAVFGSIIELILTILFIPIIIFFSWIYKSKSELKKIRVVWGPNSLNSVKNNAKMLQSDKIISHSFVDHIYSINQRDDFDYYYFDKRNFLKIKILQRYFAFISILKNYDVIITNYNGGFLRYTILRIYEHVFLKISNKKLIVWPYGSDSTVYSEMQDHSFRYGYYKSYPHTALRESQIKNQISYFTKHAHFAIGNVPHHESCPRWDVLTVACYGVDTKKLIPDPQYHSANDGKNGTVVIVHSINHRYVKGTEFLVNAVDEIEQEGYLVELKIIENMNHEEVLEIMKNSDIIAAQFLYGYALTEIEGMSLGKPVLSNLDNLHFYQAAKRYTYFNECPILSTTPENLKVNLLKLIADPALRESLGKKGRMYVEKYHSYEGQRILWEGIINKVVNKSDEKIEDWWKKNN